MTEPVLSVVTQNDCCTQDTERSDPPGSTSCGVVQRVPFHITTCPE
jgi:hypothetical protein